MPYYLLDDQFADDPVWDALGDGKQAVTDAVQLAFAKLASEVSRFKSDGYVTDKQALKQCRKPDVVERLTRTVLGRPPLLHRPGDDCKCLPDTWQEGYAYRIHEFLRRNPSKREYERNQGQKADLRDAPLKAMVYDRDGGSCRYCRSGPLSPKAGKSKDRRKVLVYDHLDPDQRAGADGDNFVVSCDACNTHKGRRTPYEADMLLLPVPTRAEKAEWAARGLALFDRPDHPPITDESLKNQRANGDPVTDRIGDTTGDRTTAHTVPAPGTSSTTAQDTASDQAGGRSGNPLGSGRGGRRADADRTRSGPPRDPDSPDIYHGRSRAAPPNCRWCNTPLDPALGGKMHPTCEDLYEQDWARDLARVPGPAPATAGGE